MAHDDECECPDCNVDSGLELASITLLTEMAGMCSSHALEFYRAHKQEILSAFNQALADVYHGRRLRGQRGIPSLN